MTANWTDQAKSSPSNWSQNAKASTSFGLINVVKAGMGWLMGQNLITMGGGTDPVSGNVIAMGALGTTPVWNNAMKS